MDNPVDNFEDKSVHNLLKTENTSHDYAYWVDFITQPPFYTGAKSSELKCIINTLCDGLLAGDSCIRVSGIGYDFEQIIADVSGTAVVDKPLVYDAPYLYFQRYWQLERQLAQRVVAVAQQPITAIDMQPYLPLLQDPLQQKALSIGVNSAFAMISGGPGTGKTYILTRIVAVLKKINPACRIAMAAPTGKAAQRMQEALQLAFNDRALVDAGLYHPDLAIQQTQTLHRLLGMGYQQRAKYHQDYPLPYDVVVVDEASMLDLSLAHALLNAIKAPTRLILLGDANQLSSVDVGYVLADLQRVAGLQAYQVSLLHSRRFSDQAQIGKFARFLQQIAQPPYVQQWLAAVEPERVNVALHHPPTLQRDAAHSDLPIDWVGYVALQSQSSASEEAQLMRHVVQGYDGYIQALLQFRSGAIDATQLATCFDDYRILLAMRSGRFGLEHINHMVSQYIRQKLHVVEPDEWYEGRAVMMVYNDYQLGLSNGDIGICLKQQQPEPHYVVYFPSLQRQISAARLPQSIQSAFALTIHKSQGSEFQHVAVLLDEQAEQLLCKELLYTAITRAKKMVTVYASPAALEQSMAWQSQRNTGLSAQLHKLFTDCTTASG